MRGDCLQRMSEIEDGTVDMVMADPPYGTTACKWDSVIDLDRMWEHLKRVIKPNGAIVLMGSQPFTTTLISSNMKMFKYCWYWNKIQGTGHLNAKKQPLRVIEETVVFCLTSSVYFPQKSTGHRRVKLHTKACNVVKGASIYGNENRNTSYDSTERYPTTLVTFSKPKGSTHPTQKPVALMAYMIKTYTNPGDTVLDFCMGSGATGVAARQFKRSFIGIEMDKGYYRIARDRIRGAV